MGHPSIFFIDDFIGFSHLVCGGVLERHPKLTIVVLEAGGGWLGALVRPLRPLRRRSTAGWRPTCALKPSEYFKRQCYISFDPDETTLPLLAPVIGEDRIVWASDYPHLDATFPGVVRELEEHLLKLPLSAQDKVRGANAAKLYGLRSESFTTRHEARGALLAASVSRDSCESEDDEECAAAALLALRLGHRTVAAVLHRGAGLRGGGGVRLRRRGHGARDGGAGRASSPASS